MKQTSIVRLPVFTNVWETCTRATWSLSVAFISSCLMRYEEGGGTGGRGGCGG